MIDRFSKKNKSRCVAFISMGQLNYISTLNVVDGVLGNSSSGLMEVPTFKKATINVGNRQMDRMKASSVIDAKTSSKQIIKAINKIYSSNFKKMLYKSKNPYGQGGASKKSLKIFLGLKKKKDFKKSFFDI